MSKAQRFVELTLEVFNLRRHSLVGYEIVADNDQGNGRTLVLKKKEPQAQAPNAPVGKAAPAKKRHRRTKAELAAAGVKSRAAQSASSVATPALPGKPFSVLEAEAREKAEVARG